MRIFFDTNILLAASIDGYLKDIEISHIDHGPAKVLLDQISKLNDEGKNYGYVTPTIEEEARAVIQKAINKTVDENWEKRNLGKLTLEKRIELADAFDLFIRTSRENLEKSVSLLVRLPIRAALLQNKLNGVTEMFNYLDMKQVQEMNQDEFIVGTSPKWKHLREKIARDRQNELSKAYKASPALNDKLLLSEILVLMKVGEEVFLVSNDGNFISEWAKQEIFSRFKVKTCKPEDLLATVKKL